MTTQAASAWRIETDPPGDVQVPRAAYYGAATIRAVHNFPVSGRSLSASVIRSLALVKGCVAQTRASLGWLDPLMAAAIRHAADEIVAGELADQFPVEVYRTGSGTSTHMNLNEVLARRAAELLGPGSTVHPNDHVNPGQSSNDVFPTAMHLAAVDAVRNGLMPVLDHMAEVLEAHAASWTDILKLGRTQMMDATPLTLGQEFSGYAAQIRAARRGLDPLLEPFLALPLGGTAVGAGLNGHPEMPARACALLAERTGEAWGPTREPFAAVASRDGLVALSGGIRTVAVAAAKIAGDIRLLGSGPRGGLGELELPALQPGSSLMPGKVNPVQCEMGLRVVARVVGCDATVASAAMGGVLELNTMMPVMAASLLEAVDLLRASLGAFVAGTLTAPRPVPERCAHWLEQGLALVTALTPLLGYDRAAALAAEARRSGRTLRAVVLAESGLEPEVVEKWLDAGAMCAPDAGRSGHGAG